MERFLGVAERILVVDDDPESVRMLGPILKDAGYEVLATLSAEKALPLIAEKRPDLVLMDIGMPRMDGYEICARILAAPELNRIPVMFITARDDPEDVVRGFQAGAVDYLVKPINRIELLGRVRNHLDRRRYERSLSLEKERFRILTENVGEAFILLDQDFSRIFYANPAFERIFGIALSEIPAPVEALEGIVRPEELAAMREQMPRAARGESAVGRESEIIRPDGTVRWVWVRATAVDSGTLKGIVAVVEDVTDRKIAERQLFETLEGESRMAGAIQRSLLMNEEDLSVPGFESVFYSAPSKNIDGDFFDAFPLGEAFDLVVGDVMGKGLNAALIGAGAKMRFLRAHAKLGASCERAMLPSTTAIVKEVDQGMAKRLIALNAYFTVQYIRFMRPDAYMEYVDCGHMPIVVWDGEACWAYKGLNPPIGFFENQEFAACRAPLRTGSTVLLYSDGITEAKAPDGGLFGEARLFESVRRSAGSGPRALVDGIRADVEAHSEGLPPSDDVTMVAFRVIRDEAFLPPRREARLEIMADLGALVDIRSAAADLLSAYAREELGDRSRDLALLAVVEAASNVMIHGLRGDRSKSFSLLLEARERWYSFAFRYAGEDFLWTRDRKPSPERGDEGGYGLYIIRNAMKSFVVSRSDTGLIEIVLSGDVGWLAP